jgi:hypothetical protein
MPGTRSRTLAVAAAIVIAQAGAFPQAAASSAPAQFPQLPLKRDLPAEGPLHESAGWAALLVLALVGAGLIMARRQRWSVTGGWRRADAKTAAPKRMGSTVLTQQASLHVVQWNGEELLLGCTSQSVSLLSRRPGDPNELPGDSPRETRKPE